MAAAQEIVSFQRSAQHQPFFGDALRHRALRRCRSSGCGSRREPLSLGVAQSHADPDPRTAVREYELA